MCLAASSNLLLVLLGDSGRVVNSLDFCLASLKSLGCFCFWCVLSSQFFYELAIFWSAKKRTQRHFFSTLHPHSTVIFATATVLALVLFHNSRFSFHCYSYTQHEAVPTQKLARKCAATSCDFLCERLRSAFILANQLC